MSNLKQISQTLSKVFTSKKFIESMIERDEPQSIFINKMSTVLRYYLLTEDTRTDLPYEGICSQFAIMGQDYPYDKILTDGVLTHSFNGYKKDRIKRYGFSYMENVSESEKNKILEAREALNYLEKILGRSSFATSEISNRVFLTSPGIKTMEYAIKSSPERLYLGPLKNLQNYHVIVGEDRATYIFRVLKRKVEEKYPDKSSLEYLKAMQSVQCVVDNYCTRPPAIALIKISDIKDKPISAGRQTTSETSLKEYIRKNVIKRKYGFFSQFGVYIDERNEMGDLSINPADIPVDAIEIVDMMDWFDILQMQARASGVKTGEMIKSWKCERTDKEPRLEDVINIIKNIDNIEELDALLQKYEPTIEKIRKDAREKLDELRNRKENVLNRKYVKKANISTEYTLSNALEKIERQGLMDLLLQKDNGIVGDSLQYRSDLHGVSHTRRVNFLAVAIMSMENVEERDREIILQIAKNHDIGRVNDIEDKEHGERSVRRLRINSERLSEFSEDEKRLIEFVVKEHSMSATENKRDIENLPPNLRKRYSRILNIFKDADKLDRVRLDSRGLYPREGLDASRLSLNSSKKLENVAYEGLDKVLEIISIEKEIARAQRRLDVCNEFDRRIQERKQICTEKSKKFLNGIVSRTKEKVSIRGIKSIASKMGDLLKTINDKKTNNNDER